MSSVTLSILLLILAQPLFGQAAGIQAPHQLAVEAAALEVRDLEPPQSFMRYRSRVVNSKGDLTRDVIESRDGSIARLVSVEGRALTPAEDEAERSRLQSMLDSPSSFAHHIKNEQSSKKQAIDVIKLIPDAMLFTYADGQPQPETLLAPPADARPLIALDYQPNPAWTPPGMAAEVLTGLKGRMWLDPRTHHVAELDITVFRPVSVGFGVLAKVFPGGTVTMGQGSPVQDRWPIYRLAEHVTLRALMVKTFKEDTVVNNSSFQQMPAMSYQDAVKLLLSTPLPK